MRVLFHVRARRGLGHLVRAGVIAEAIARARPDAELIVAVSHEAPPELIGPHARLVVLDGGGSTHGLLSAERPLDLVVFDTMLPDDWPLIQAGPAPALALVLREMRPGALATLLAHPLFPRIDRVLIPHAPDEFDPRLENAKHVGSIARGPRLCRGGRRFPDDRPLVITTAGGGGHRELCEAFLATAVAADRLLRARRLDFHHLMVTGPRYAGALPDAGEIELSRFEPELPALLGDADLVVSRAGYNTVNELLETDTPAVLVPGNPGLDDQRGRALRLAHRGRALLSEPGDAEGLAGMMAVLLRGANGERRRRAADAGRRRREAREGAAPISPGARRAAAELVDLIESRPDPAAPAADIAGAR